MIGKKIFFVHAGLSTFVKCDLDILSENYDVVQYYYKPSRNIFGKIGNIFKSFLTSAYNVAKSDAVFVWFGGFHGFFPVLFAKILKKKSIVVVGGYDASYIPSIKYGVFYHGGFQLWATKKVYCWATNICPVDESLVRSTNYYADPSGVGYKTGILNHMELDEGKIEVVPTGYDSEFWKPNHNTVREGVIALAYVYNTQTYILKGFDLLVECAKMLPKIPFTFAGFSPEMFEKTQPNIPANVTLLSFQTPEEAKRLFQRHKVFILPSMTEGLPNTLCEAMLCGCIPIVSNVGVMPALVGKLGYVLDQKKPENLKILIQNAVLNENFEIEKIGEKIYRNFFRGIRSFKLQELINKEP